MKASAFYSLGDSRRVAPPCRICNTIHRLGVCRSLRIGVDVRDIPRVFDPHFAGRPGGSSGKPRILLVFSVLGSSPRWVGDLTLFAKIKIKTDSIIIVESALQRG